MIGQLWACRGRSLRQIHICTFPGGLWFIKGTLFYNWGPWSTQSYVSLCSVSTVPLCSFLCFLTFALLCVSVSDAAVQASWRPGCLSWCWWASSWQWPWPSTSGDLGGRLRTQWNLLQVVRGGMTFLTTRMGEGHYTVSSERDRGHKDYSPLKRMPNSVPTCVRMLGLWEAGSLLHFSSGEAEIA